MSNDVEQRLAALNETELRTILRYLVTALHDEDTDQCYRVLRDWGLEQDLSPANDLSTEELDAIDNRNHEALA